jgi:DNA-binding transcriptional ArsR family regulator
MSPSATDTFAAIAEPRRRELLERLRGGERDVSGLVEDLGWPQALVSKHLAVLREVELVHVRAEGRRRVYRINGERLKSVHEWAATFERLWTHQLDRIKRRAESKAREGRADESGTDAGRMKDSTTKENRP